MIKKKAVIFVILCWIIFSISCSITPPTYSRKDIDTAIKNLCQKEFNIKVNVWETGDTIWVYCPFENIFDKNGKINNDVSEKVRKIFLSFRRVILSMDKRPEFYCFVESDTKVGADIYYVWNIMDLVMLETNYISLGQFEERAASFYSSSQEAKTDTEGKHIPKYDITLPEFISYLIRQNIERYFASDKNKDNFKINEMRAKYASGRLDISFNIAVTKPKEGLTNPFNEAEIIAKKFLKIYNYPPQIREVVITDTLTKRSRLYSRQALIAKK
jgi:hypothetical protein